MQRDHKSSTTKQSKKRLDIWCKCINHGLKKGSMLHFDKNDQKWRKESRLCESLGTRLRVCFILFWEIALIHRAMGSCEDVPGRREPASLQDDASSGSAFCKVAVETINGRVCISLSASLLACLMILAAACCCMHLHFFFGCCRRSWILPASYNLNLLHTDGGTLQNPLRPLLKSFIYFLWKSDGLAS